MSEWGDLSLNWDDAINRAMDSQFNISESPSFSFGNFNPTFDTSWLSQFSAPQLQLGFQNPSMSIPTGGFSLGGTPFNPASVGAPPMGGPAPASFGPMPGAAPTGGMGTTAAASAPLGSPSLSPGDGARPPIPKELQGGSLLTNGDKGWKPGSQMAPTPPAETGMNWGGLGKDLLKAAIGSGTGALIGGGLNLLGSALAPKPERPKPQGGGGAPAPAPATPLPPPTTPTGTPNVPESAPLPGAQWSPLLMQNKQPNVVDQAGLEAQKRMRRGGQTGGLALY